ncbi:MAG: phosphoglucosamine mutase [Schwartzia sp.]|nr:phosphoglucosamine mutase [Schwartzia sp. (in: firmicutes)]
MARMFGTDGVRGEANLGLTPELAYRLGRAAAIYFGKEGTEKPQILIGRDTRISGAMFISALAAGVCSAGGHAVIVGVIPTPAIAYLAKKHDMAAGIVVSASHNPFGDNGIKFFGGDGYKLPDEVEDEIERLVHSIEGEDPFYRPSGSLVGTLKYRKELLGEYMDYVLSTTDTRLDGLKIVLDCANGAAYEAMPAILRSLGADLIVIHNEPNGVNINDACGSTHLDSLIRAVRENGADIGVAHDGDADRCLCVDEQGNVIDGDHMLVLCGLALKEKGALPNDTIVTTVMANIGFHKAVKAAGGRVEVTKVGDRYVLEEMRTHGYALGGEQSGHIIFSDLATTGDGLITALQVLGVLKRSGGPASKLTAMMTSYPQLLVNVEVKSKEGWEENPAIQKAIAAEEALLGDNGRILVRPSGTEPLIRVMAEGPEQGQLEEICRRIADVVRAELG